MYIEFISLEFKNILSYGNKVTLFDFTKGLNSIVGVNGQGKSAFLDALSFCLYGKPYREIKIKDLVNRINKKNLWTRTVFKIKNNVYTITRSLAPDKIEILLNGDPLELLSAKRLIQEEINRILGIDYTMFKYVMGLAVNSNPAFLSLSLPNKRDFTESMFRIKVFGNMLKNVKKKNSEDKVQNEINMKTLSVLESEVESIEDQIEEIEKTILEFDQNKANDLQKVEDSLHEYEQRVKKCEKNIEIGETTLSKLVIEDVSKLRNKLKIISEKVVLFKHRKTEIKNSLQHLNENDKCMYCNNLLTDEYKSEQHVLLDKELSSIDNKLVNHNEVIKKLRSEINKAEKVSEKKRQIERALDQQNDKKEMYESEIENYNDAIEDIKNRKLDFDVKKLKKRFFQKSKELSQLRNETRRVGKELNYNKIIMKILSEQGIKSHFFKKLIPILNAKINEYLELFDLPVILTFNELMEETITAPNGRTILQYSSHSTGEKKRMDISILLAFIDTMKVISNWQCNLLFFDEIFDSGMDTAGLDKILLSLKRMTNENSGLCIYLISHKMVDESIFNNKINVSKVGSFSRMSLLLGERNND